MNAGEQFIVAVLQSKTPALFFQVRDEWWMKEERRYVDFIREYFKEENELPPLSVLEKKFKVELPAVRGRAGHYYRELKERYVYTTLALETPKVIRKLKENPLESLSRLREIVSLVDSGENTSKDIAYNFNALTRYDEYKRRIDNKGITYISTGNEVMDGLLFGYHRTDLITYAGRSGLGKTWELLWDAIECAAALPDDLGDVMFVSNEIGIDELMERMDCIMFRLPYEQFQKGELTPLQRMKYKKGLTALATVKNRLRIIYNCNTLEMLRYKITIYQPSVVFVDGSYLMEPEMPIGWEKIQFITQGLKNSAKDMQIPHINSTQLKRTAGKRAIPESQCALS